jgi:predicted TIM-barrel fold metal-dependent hydrolase
VALASDWPHGDTAWPESVEQTLDRARLSKNAKRKILGENALRLCPRLRS